MPVKRLGVLTSGGDAPGMNAAIRAVVRTAVSYGMQCLGIRRGYNGLINGDIVKLETSDVSGLTGLGGTILHTARCKEFMTKAGLEKARDTCKNRGIDALVCIGGDGTFRGALDLAQYGISCCGVPGTIDNDIACSNYTIGFDTACNTAVEAIDRLNDTMQSHERCSVVEVMGHRAGHLAVYVGIACGANAILVPEKPVDLQKDIVDNIRYARDNGRTHFVVVVAEGAGGAVSLAPRIQEATGMDTRITVLGHIQRGGRPNARDRVTASRMGKYAVDVLAEGRTNRVVGIIGGNLQDYDITEALKMERGLQESMYETARVLTLR
ncbi:MAG: 6-phosphofructokinase [Oscillospiraceae bacterium]|jgi:6-phosphofructokinase 1|nr:6-phosphofructokinase [Oscillospiraceae bacterium]